MEILRASEDYLESMLMMKLKHGYIRSIDVAEHLGVTKPSVTYATRRLKESGHITMDKDGLITLTETGMAVAAKMLDRHKTLTAFLIALGVDAKTAEEDACKIRNGSRSDASAPVFCPVHFSCFSRASSARRASFCACRLSSLPFTTAS